MEHRRSSTGRFVRPPVAPSAPHKLVGVVGTVGADRVVPGRMPVPFGYIPTWDGSGDSFPEEPSPLPLSLERDGLKIHGTGIEDSRNGKDGDIAVHLRDMRGHPKQEAFVESKVKRKVVRAGRRGGKTVGIATLAVKQFLAGRRQLYATPTSEQMGKFWFEVNAALEEPIRAGIYKKNETEHYIEKVGTEERLKAKTAWNADTLRGDYADDLYLDEYQLMDEDTWEVVGAPMLLDNDGNAVFIYTPPSLRSSGISKARDPMHAAKMYRRAKGDKTGRWEAFTFTSHDNPFISEEALREIISDMSREAYRHEILAEDEEANPAQLIYSVFNERTQKIGRFPLPGEWPRYVGHDFGAANPAALFLAQDSATGFFYIYQEYLPGAGRSTAQHVDEFKRMVEGMNVLMRKGGSHQEDGVRDGYTAHGWPILEPMLKGVNAQIDRVKGMMELNKIFVFNDLHNTLEELMNYQWRLDTEGKLTDEIHNKANFHLMDCLRSILCDFRPDTVATGKVRVVNWAQEREKKGLNLVGTWW